MATINFCDCCGKEAAKNRKHNQLIYLCHIDDILDHDAGKYCDNDGNAISGRSESVDLCNQCYNRIVIEAVKKFRDLKKE